MAEAVAVCRVEEVPEGRGRSVRLGDWSIAVFREGQQCFALLDRCPHAGAALSSGWIEEGAVVCPLHQWRFRLSDGHCIAGGQGDATLVSVFEREGWIWVSPEGMERDSR